MGILNVSQNFFGSETFVLKDCDEDCANDDFQPKLNQN